MSAMLGDWRFRVHVVQVGLAGNVSAVATQLDGAADGELWQIETSVSLQEFLQRPNLEIEDDVPVVRLDLTDDQLFWKHLREGPHLNGMLPLGTISARSGVEAHYAGESPAQLRGWWVAADVYGQLAATAGLVVELARNHVAVPQHERHRPAFRVDDVP